MIETRCHSGRVIVAIPDNWQKNAEAIADHPVTHEACLSFRSFGAFAISPNGEARRLARDEAKEIPWVREWATLDQKPVTFRYPDGMMAMDLMFDPYASAPTVDLEALGSQQRKR